MYSLSLIYKSAWAAQMLPSSKQQYSCGCSHDLVPLYENQRGCWCAPSPAGTYGKHSSNLQWHWDCKEISGQNLWCQNDESALREHPRTQRHWSRVRSRQEDFSIFSRLCFDLFISLSGPGCTQRYDRFSWGERCCDGGGGMLQCRSEERNTYTQNYWSKQNQTFCICLHAMIQHLDVTGRWDYATTSDEK